MSLIVVKGVNLNKQEGLFSSFLSRYVEETAAASISEPSQKDYADINSIFAQGNDDGSKDSLDPQILQDDSLVAYNSVLENIGIGGPGTGGEISDYTVQDGDTISFIASDFGVSVNTIIWANNLKSADEIKPGMTLKIPPVTGVVHVVKSGDTLASIAKKYGADKDKIVSFNNLPDSDELSVDVEIIIPDGIIRATPKAPASSSPAVAVLKRFANLPVLAGFFGLPTAPNYRLSQRVHGRNGVDLADSCGTPIYAAAGGTVNLAKNSGYNGGFGKFVRITHPNGTETLYGHASQVLVSAGQVVARGQQIAVMGSTGRSTGCHLHFEVHGASNPFATSKNLVLQGLGGND